MHVDINPYDRSVTIDGVKVKEKINPFPDKLNHLSTISCDYDATLDVITDVHNIHRYVSHFIAREYYYEHLKEFVDWYYLEQEAQLLEGDSEGFGKIVVNDVTLDADVHGDTLYFNAGEGIEIIAEKEEVSQAKVIRVTEKYIDVAYAESLTNISDKLRVGGLAVITNEEGTTFFYKEDDVTFKELEVKGTGGSTLPADFLIDFEKMKEKVTELGVISGEHTEQLEELEAKPVAEVGSIIHSLLPIDNVSHHLLDGTLLNGTGIYANFYEHIAKVFDSGRYSSLFIEEDEWQESIATYGVCGKFVLNQVNKTIRLPKITGFIEGTLDSTALGDLVKAGLPNIVGKMSGVIGVNTAASNGALSWQTSYDQEQSYTAGNGYANIVLDASESSPIYGNSDTVQPQSIKGYIYMIVATGVSATVEVDLKGVEKALFDLEKKVEEIGDNGSGHAIGEIVHSLLPIDNAGFHLLDGSVLSGDGVYSEFVEYIKTLYEGNEYPNLFTTESAYSTSISSYGVCGKFIYNSTANTVRLPRVTGFIEGTIDSSVIGDLVEAGLPNITGDTGYALYGAANGHGAFEVQQKNGIQVFRV